MERRDVLKSLVILPFGIGLLNGKQPDNTPIPILRRQEFDTGTITDFKIIHLELFTGENGNMEYRADGIGIIDQNMTMSCDGTVTRESLHILLKQMLNLM
jgi:hypothetical protein